MFKGLQWKVVLLYTLLLLFALQLIGVYMVQSLERYYLRNFISGIENQAKLLSTYLSPRLTEGEDSGVVELLEGFRGNNELDIVVLDRYSRVVGASGYPDEEEHRLIQEEIIKALGGTPSDEVRADPDSEQRYYYLAYPIKSNGMVSGVVYLSASLESIDQTLGEIKGILITGSLIVLAVSVSVGVILARTITTPIQEVTKKAESMAGGDFSQRMKVHAEDEIGHLARMFNYLAYRLKSTLNEISSEKSKVEAILNYMSDGIIAFDGEGNVIHVNPAARRILEQVTSFSEETEKVGLNLLANLLGDKLYQEFSQNRRPFSVEVSREHPAITLQVSVAPFKEEMGKLKGVLLVLHDITKEREISQRQQEFVANVSHELKTPLTSIKSYMEALLDGAAEDSSLRTSFMEVVNKETERMVTMVKDLLELSQIDEQSISLNQSEHNLKKLITEAIEKVRFRFPERPLLQVEVSDALFVKVDRDRIYQVFINLINNAGKFSSPEGKVTISARQKDNRVHVCVEDNGPGIPSEDLSRVFDRFYRVEKTRSRDYGGTGLGLSICKQVVEAHDGKIWIESERGAGTAVWFTLPAA